MLGNATLDQVGNDIFDLVIAVAGGAQSKSEELGHREFILNYKAIEAVGPACHPGRR
jgi:altronate hydrolase